MDNCVSAVTDPDFIHACVILPALRLWSFHDITARFVANPREFLEEYSRPMRYQFSLNTSDIMLLMLCNTLFERVMFKLDCLKMSPSI